MVGIGAVVETGVIDLVGSRYDIHLTRLVLWMIVSRLIHIIDGEVHRVNVEWAFLGPFIGILLTLHGYSIIAKRSAAAARYRTVSQV